MADVIKKLGHTVEEVDGHLDSTELHIQEGERDKWNKAADTAKNVNERLKAAESDTGWVDCLPSITAESFALDAEYSNVAKIRRVGKYVSLRATLKFISDGNDGHVRGFLHNMVPEGYRPSDMLFAIMNYGKYNSPTSATYKVLSAQVNGGDLTLFLNDGGTVADLYGYIVRINMDWLLG